MRLFLDEGLGRYQLVGLLRAAGIDALPFYEHFEDGTDDHVWIPEVARRGSVVLEKDKAHTYTHPEIRVIVRSEARMFSFCNGNMSARTMAEIAIRAHARMRTFVEGRPAPFLARIRKDGSVHEQTLPDPATVRRGRGRAP